MDSPPCRQAVTIHRRAAKGGGGRGFILSYIGADQGGEMPYDKSESFASLRAAWARGKGHQAEQLSLPGTTGRNAGRSLGGGYSGFKVLCCFDSFCFL